MGFLARVRGLGAVCLCGVALASGPATTRAKVPAPVSAWEQAQKVRAAFEAAPNHTKIGYGGVGAWLRNVIIQPICWSSFGLGNAGHRGVQRRRISMDAGR